MVGDLQAQVIKSIVNIFETGSVLGDYATVVSLKNDRGGLTFGRTQTTINSGGLFKLIDQYVNTPGALFQNQLRNFVDGLQRRDQALNTDGFFHNLLRASADDPLMRKVQDDFFDENYYGPALEDAAEEGITDALGVAVVYDSIVHGSWKSGANMYRRANSRAGGRPGQVGAREWLSVYVDTRREWLANHSNALLPLTVYRMDTFRALMDGDRWDLQPPLLIHGREVTEAALTALPEDVYDGPLPGARSLDAEGSSLLRGLDVRVVQVALSAPPFSALVKADGIFGPATAGTVRRFQEARGLPPSGVVDQTTFDALGITQAAQDALRTITEQGAAPNLPGLAAATASAAAEPTDAPLDTRADAPASTDVGAPTDAPIGTPPDAVGDAPTDVDLLAGGGAPTPDRPDEPSAPDAPDASETPDPTLQDLPSAGTLPTPDRPEEQPQDGPEDPEKDRT